MRDTSGDTIAQDMRMYTITIPANTGNGSSISTLLSAVPADVLAKVMGWEIKEPTDAYKISMGSGMANPVLNRASGQDWSPPLNHAGMSDIFLRSASSSSITAVMVLYLAREFIVKKDNPPL